ncbi:hypothetical protein B0H12DRAFT_1245403 [Mycena haematopus]|nr:hypothetical protein B0H12DRAFT_1245403 [Mycena haematopus]
MIFGAKDRHAAACIICAQPHSAQQHPATSQTFLDGSSHHARLDGKELRPSNGPADGSICIRFNLGLPCDSRHPPTRTHTCSLCGGPHPALSAATPAEESREGISCLEDEFLEGRVP